MWAHTVVYNYITIDIPGAPGVEEDNSLSYHDHYAIHHQTLIHMCFDIIPPLTGFHGKLRSMTYRNNLYIYYFQVADFVKYNGVYKDPLLARDAAMCPDSSASANDTKTLFSNEDISDEIPPDGTVRVYAKCPLRVNKTYFVSGHLHATKNGRPRLIMCCTHADEHYAITHLADLLHRQECCRHI